MVNWTIVPSDMYLCNDIFLFLAALFPFFLFFLGCNVANFKPQDICIRSFLFCVMPISPVKLLGQGALSCWWLKSICSPFFFSFFSFLLFSLYPQPLKLSGAFHCEVKCLLGGVYYAQLLVWIFEHNLFSLQIKNMLRS